MAQKLEMPYEAWMRMQAVSAEAKGKAARIAAILEELSVCTKEGPVLALSGPLPPLKELAESIYQEIWERSPAVN